MFWLVSGDDGAMIPGTGIGLSLARLSAYVSYPLNSYQICQFILTRIAIKRYTLTVSSKSYWTFFIIKQINIKYAVNFVQNVEKVNVHTHDVIYSYRNGAKICKENPRVFTEKKIRGKSKIKKYSLYFPIFRFVFQPRNSTTPCKLVLRVELFSLS